VRDIRSRAPDRKSRSDRLYDLRQRLPHLRPDLARGTEPPQTLDQVRNRELLERNGDGAQ